MKVTVEATHCTDIKCPYLKVETIYPPDSFEMPYSAAECMHPKARSASHNHPCLGCDDDYPYEDYCKIPEWCPMVEVAEVPKGPTNQAKMDEIISQFKESIQEAFGIPPWIWIDINACDLFKHSNLCHDSKRCTDCKLTEWLKEPYDEDKSKLRRDNF